MTEQDVIEQLSRYRQMQARIQVLSTYSVGAGITVSRLNQDDQLQELHRKLRGLPSYMYLSLREQRLENIAHAYLGQTYPAGAKSQQRAIAEVVGLEEDEKLLRELKDKIAKVVVARGYGTRDDIDAILDRLAELQDLQAEINRVDTVLKALEVYKPQFARLLRLHVIDGMTSEQVAEKIGVAERTIRRWKPLAINEFLKMSG